MISISLVVIELGVLFSIILSASFLSLGSLLDHPGPPQQHYSYRTTTVGLLAGNWCCLSLYKHRCLAYNTYSTACQVKSVSKRTQCPFVHVSNLPHQKRPVGRSCVFFTQLSRGNTDWLFFIVLRYGDYVPAQRSSVRLSVCGLIEFQYAYQSSFSRTDPSLSCIVWDCRD